MDVDGTMATTVVSFADFFEELFAGFNTARGFGEGKQEIEFDRGEVEGLVVEGGGSGGGLNVERARCGWEPVRGRGRWGCVGSAG